MAFELKPYQKRCIKELEKYFRRTTELDDANTAFYKQVNRKYYPVKGLEGLPYVCIRVPTGGGKTALAAYSVGTAAENLLRTERCLVLWLAPTTQIVEQTLNALQDKRHPYRQALDNDFDGCVSVLDIKAALGLQRGTLESDTVIVVSTMHAPRIGETEGRRIYAEDNSALMPHFENLKAEQLLLLDKTEAGKPACSLANVFRLHRPIIIVDEAHNARTPLSFESLARFRPSCILEFTATPNQNFEGGNEPSNVLTHVSAAELKTDQMIKLPIYLKAKPQWIEAVREALDKQTELEKLAIEEEKETGQYIRPIILFQAQRNITGEQNITYDVLKKKLIEEFQIHEEQIAISTGAQNDLEGIDVLSKNEKIRYIITVDKLREGWDCPFAYILCTISNLRSSTAVEQILGRILRMPYVTKRTYEELNRAYAYTTSSDFKAAADTLTEALVDSGFEKFEAKEMVKSIDGGNEFLPLFHSPVSETISTKINTKDIPENLRDKLSFRETETGLEVVYTGPAIKAGDAEKLKEAINNDKDKNAIERLVRKSRGQESTPAAVGAKFEIPILAMRIDRQLELFEDQFREVPWKLSSCDATLSEQDFSLNRAKERTANIDVTKDGKIEYSFISELQRQLSLSDIHGPKNETELTIWLDQNINHKDITQIEANLFISKMISSLIKNRGLTLEELIINRWRLKDATEQLISQHRKIFLKQTYQRMLLPEFETPLEVDPTFCFTFDNNRYPASRFYDGPFKPSKHFYLNPGDMNGEEADCAAFIDGLDEVEYWVRNLDREDYSFWLQTSTDKFYPDFVVQLKDGRVLVVEYKGAHIADSADTEEKDNIGKIWAMRSKGRCLFRMVGKDDYQAKILSAIGK
ncbi:MAG: DEAD/DEAH box helicase family protein [Planctomycetes bacterium]|nr:DEAD/DEAH box helicase family protein [Planctomycetota bacterium]MBU1518797.1 DEAD/DEAH box helicase family protein [Planctomycetota bacterium]MBU2458348.1 DEAD/DEAH box helicase family protein [Planctomycetota bacterium]